MVFAIARNSGYGAKKRKCLENRVSPRPPLASATLGERARTLNKSF